MIDEKASPHTIDILSDCSLLVGPVLHLVVFESTVKGAMSKEIDK